MGYKKRKGERKADENRGSLKEKGRKKGETDTGEGEMDVSTNGGEQERRKKESSRDREGVNDS